MMYRLATACVIVGVLAFVAADLAAQQGQRQGRGPGFGGRGFGGGSLAGLLRVEEVQQEIKLTDTQQEEIQAAMRAMRPAAGQGQRGAANFQDMTEQERTEAFARMREQAQQRAKATKEALAKILSADQMKRLTEISVQQQGVRALADEDVAAAVKLTDDQKSKIAELMQANRPGRGGAGQAQTDRAAAREQMRQRREQLNKDVMAVLTTEQQAAFKELQGKPFEMPAGRGPGAGGGRGAGRAGGGQAT